MVAAPGPLPNAGTEPTWPLNGVADSDWPCSDGVCAALKGTGDGVRVGLKVDVCRVASGIDEEFWKRACIPSLPEVRSAPEGNGETYWTG